MLQRYKDHKANTILIYRYSIVFAEWDFASLNSISQVVRSGILTSILHLAGGAEWDFDLNIVFRK